MYLVEGTEKAVLVDTGVGLGDIRSLVQELTALPVTVLLTHGHYDHAGGVSLFESAYLHPADIPIYEEMCLGKTQIGFANYVGTAVPYTEADFVIGRKMNFLPLHAGDLFDLGGLTAEVIDGFGHTPGSVALLLREKRILILGDVCNQFTFLFFDHSSSISRYMETLERLQSREADFDRILILHGDGDAPLSLITEVKEVCKRILSGQDAQIPFDFRGTPAWIAEPVDPFNNRIDGMAGNIVYNINRL